jgi:hypothetical protein
MSTASPKNTRLVAVICFVLAAVTMAVYWPVTRHGFINFDDPPYITENPNVRDGLTWHGLAWAFQIGYAAYWQPLTWISHMMDCQSFRPLRPQRYGCNDLIIAPAKAEKWPAWARLGYERSRCPLRSN